MARQRNADAITDFNNRIDLENQRLANQALWIHQQWLDRTQDAIGYYQTEEKLIAHLASIKAMQDPFAVSNNSAAFYAGLQRATPSAPAQNLDLIQLYQKFSTNPRYHDVGGIVSGPVGSPQVIVAHGGEEVVRYADRKGDDKPSGKTMSAQFIFQAPIYGVEDLTFTINTALDKWDRENHAN